MSGLISGKEALIALANGSVVQGNIGFGWIDIDLNDDILLNSFITERNRNGVAVKFRLKPRTITINGIEVPAPFEPKLGDDCKCYYINTTFSSGFDWYHSSHHQDYRLVWKSEDEIKQVIAALKKIFVINNQ